MSGCPQIFRHLAPHGEIELSWQGSVEDLLLSAGARDYRPRENSRRLVSIIGAEMIAAVTLPPLELDSLSQRSRGSLRTGVAEALKISRLYGRLAGTPYSGDERLLLALRWTASSREGTRRPSPHPDQIAGNTFSLEKFGQLINPQKQLDKMLRPSSVQQFLDGQDRIAKFMQPRFKDPFLGAGVDPARKLRSPTMDALANAQKHIDKMLRPPGLRKLLDGQDRIAKFMQPRFKDPFLGVGGDPAKAFRSPAMDALANAQKHIDKMLRPPALNRFLDDQGRIQELLDRIVREAGSAYQSTISFVEHWTNQGRSPERPPPEMFVIGLLPVSLGITIFESLKSDDHSELLALLDPVLTDPGFIDEAQAAVLKSPILHDASKEQLIDAFDLLGKRKFVSAYPLFYSGLESAFTETARSNGVLDADNYFLKGEKKKKRKTEDLFPFLELSPQFRRYLNSWIFGDAGNPFRHGDVRDPELCRRQALKLAAALVGWLEELGGWDDAKLANRIETASQLQLGE